MVEIALLVLNESESCISYLSLDIFTWMTHRAFKFTMVKIQYLCPISKTLLFLCSLFQKMETLPILVFKSGTWELTLTPTPMMTLEYVSFSIALCTPSQILFHSHLSPCNDFFLGFLAFILTLLHSLSQRELSKAQIRSSH